VQSGPFIETYNTEDEVVRHTSDHLYKCFHLAYSAPCYCGKLFDDVGFMGDTKCAHQILEGTYDFPSGYQHLDKEDFAGGTLYILSYV
jgi:hypothetical protein